MPEHRRDGVVLERDEALSLVVYQELVVGGAVLPVRLPGAISAAGLRKVSPGSLASLRQMPSASRPHALPHDTPRNPPRIREGFARATRKFVARRHRAHALHFRRAQPLDQCAWEFAASDGAGRLAPGFAAKWRSPTASAATATRGDVYQCWWRHLINGSCIVGRLDGVRPPRTTPTISWPRPVRRQHAGQRSAAVTQTRRAS